MTARKDHSAAGRHRRAFSAAVAVALALLSPATFAAAPLSPQEEAGKKVFVQGVGSTKFPIKALVGAHGSEVDATTLPCASCHGADALGRPEGAVKPSNITWPALTKPYGARSESGRERGPYTDQSFAEALTFGKDSSGNKLDPTMPRYVMGNEDIANLLAYLKRIEADLDPGIADDRLRIGTLLPASGRAAEVSHAMQMVMQGHVDQINSRGGLFGRKLDLVVADLPEDAASAEQAAERLMRDGRVFALVGPYAAGLEAPLFRLAESTGVPVVGPFTMAPPDEGQAINRHTYYLLPGLRDQVRALAGFAAKELPLKDPVAAIVHPAGDGELANALEERLGDKGWKRVLQVRYSREQMPTAKLVAALQQQGVQVIFFLGNDAELAVLGKDIRDAIWTPYLLALGARVGPAALNLPTTLGNRVFVAYPTLPADITPAGVQELAAVSAPKAGPTGADHSMHGMHQMGAAPGQQQRHLPARVSAYSAMLVLEEGLKRAGRDLSRAKLVAALDKLFSFETGVMPTITFGPNRRVGALGAHIVAADLTAHRFRRTGHYIRVD